jgi:phage baseplate assembly protein W
MARPPIMPSNLIPRPFIGAGWHFPLGRGRALDPDDAKREMKVKMAADEISVRQSIEIILSTAKGERVMRPDFGCNLNRLLFSPNNGTTRALAAFEVQEALRSWEPRIDVIEVAVRAVSAEGEQLLIDIDYRVRNTDDRFNFVYPFYLNRPLV